MGKHEKPEREVDSTKGKHSTIRLPDTKGSGISKHGQPGHNVTDKKGKK